jgi:hypothetical protein
VNYGNKANGKIDKTYTKIMKSFLVQVDRAMSGDLAKP